MILFISKPDSSHFALPYLRYLPHEKIESDSALTVRTVAQKFPVVWLEWANSYTARMLERKFRAFTIVRVHDYEIRSRIVRNVNWDNANLIWFVNSRAQRDFNSLVRTNTRQFVLPNAIDLEKWPVVAEGHKHIGLITLNVQRRKRIDRAIDLMASLPGWRLTIRTSRANHFDYPNGVAELKRRASRYGERIRFEYREISPGSIVDNADVVHFWKDKSHVISTSSHEAFNYTFAEGLACGAAGACFDWEWGNPREFYGSLVSKSIPGMVEQIKRSSPGIDNRLAVERFDAPLLATELRRIIYANSKIAINSVSR